MNQEVPTGQRTTHGVVRTLLVGAAIVVAMSTFYVAPKLTTRTVGTTGGAVQANGGDSNAAPGAMSGTANPTATPGAGAGTTGNAPPTATAASHGVAAGQPPANIACAPGRNGGATDIGVDATTIHLAATDVESGVGASFLGPVKYGMDAVVQKINAAGGICGRQIDLRLKDDGWSPTVGRQFLDNFIADANPGTFAFAVVPSSEGLNAASLGHDLDNAQDPKGGTNGIPVIGSDGMLKSQYGDPMIWPVAASTATSMRIIARDAHARGARTFAIVYESSYRFGVEGAGAFQAQVKRDGGTLNGSCIVGLASSSSGTSSYSTQVNQFNQSCGTQSSSGGVDFVALLLEPQTAEAWLQSNPYMGIRSSGSGEGAAGPQPLFDYNFGNNCAETCSNMRVWTSFKPPIFPYSQDAKVEQFKQDLCAVDSDCQTDAESAFTESGYVGMELVVQALQKTGPFLTRDRLKATLNSMSLDTGLTLSALGFSSGNHTANQTMVAFTDTYAGQFGGFVSVQGSQQSDPCPGCNDPDISS